MKDGELLMELIIALLAVGVPGFFSYWYLNQIGFLNYSNQAQEEKRTIQIILSLINIGVSFSVWFLIESKGNLQASLQVETMKVIDVITLLSTSIVVTSILTGWIYPLIIKYFINKMGKFRLKHNLPLKTQETVYEMLVHKKEYSHTLVYVFDFDDKFIESGYLSKFSDNSDSINLSLALDTFHTKEKYELIDILGMFNGGHYANDAKEIYLDFDRRIKIFFFYHN